MPLSGLISTILLYPLVLAGDGCILIAIALVATTGGSPWVCGAAFAFFHAFYSILGIALVSELVEYSETLEEVIVLVGSLVLLKHFIHHRLHNGSHGDCSCEHHHPIVITPLQIFSTAAALSVHALATGPIVRNISGINETSRLIPLLLASSALLGVFISLIVFVGEQKRAKILRFLDALPGVVTGTLVAICCYSLSHVVEHLVEPPHWVETLLLMLGAIISVVCGYVMHTKTAKPIIHLSKIEKSSPH